jgi:Protein of unknown function (DUF4242)
LVKAGRIAGGSQAIGVHFFGAPIGDAYRLQSNLNSEVAAMPKYVIEREIPGAGNFSTEQLQAISQKSCGVLKNLGPSIQWIESFVTDNKIYCVYIAPNEEMVREHAKQGGFPANSVAEVRRMIDPTTAESSA